jgi:hypothetical protein
MNIKLKSLLIICLVYSLQFILGNLFDLTFIKKHIYKSTIIQSESDKLSKTDYLIMGGSNGLVSFDSKRISEEASITIFNLSEDDTNLKLHLLQLKMLLERNVKPKGILLAIGSMNNEFSRNSLRYLPHIGHDKEVNAYFLEKEPFTYYIYLAFPIFKWAKHNNDLLFPLILTLFIKPNYHHRFDEFGDYSYPIDKNALKSNSMQEPLVLDPNNLLLNEFKQLCNQANIELFIINTPYYYGEIQWINTENKLNFSTFQNTNNSLFYDKVHLNSKGKSLFTSAFLKRWNN